MIGMHPDTRGYDEAQSIIENIQLAAALYTFFGEDGLINQIDLILNELSIKQRGRLLLRIGFNKELKPMTLRAIADIEGCGAAAVRASEFYAFYYLDQSVIMRKINEFKQGSISE